MDEIHKIPVCLVENDVTGCDLLGLVLIGDSYVLQYHVTVLKFNGVNVVELWDSWRWVPCWRWQPGG